MQLNSNSNQSLMISAYHDNINLRIRTSNLQNQKNVDDKCQPQSSFVSQDFKNPENVNLFTLKTLELKTRKNLNLSTPETLKLQKP